MSFPTLAGEVIQEWAREETKRFPFVWWAKTSHFDYPDGARHLFCKTQSAAEAFYLRQPTLMVAATFEPDAIVYADIRVTPQLRAAKYFLDFAVVRGSRRLAVEVDGLAFHQRTHDQVEADYLRQRRLTALGWSVVRFTAGEVFRDAAECWKQTLAIIDSRITAD